MTLPSWVEIAKGLIGSVVAKPIAGSKQARLAAAYLGLRVGWSVARVLKLGLASPMKDLADIKRQQIRSESIAAGAAASNKVITDRLKAEAEAELTRAEADRTRAEAEGIRGRSAIERGRFELEKLERQQGIANANLERKRAQLDEAIRRLELGGGKVYLPEPDDEGNLPEAETG